MGRPPLWLSCLWLAIACRPESVPDAEAKGDVAWLDQNGTPESVAALGRLADHDPRATKALFLRSSFDGQAYRAAWSAVLRNKSWGTDLLREGLRDPKRAELAAGGMGRSDPMLADFVADLDAALVRIAASPQSFIVAGVLASAGAPAHRVLVARLLDASSRSATCRGIASEDANAEARSALFEVPETARDAPACVDAVVHLASANDATLAWLAESGEPGLLVAAGKDDGFPCARLHETWVKAFGKRPASVYPALTVPLGYAVKRCPAELDGVLADTLTRVPAAHGVVVEAIDPWQDYGNALRATCAALSTIGLTKDSPVVRERASDARVHVCKMPG